MFMVLIILGQLMHFFEHGPLPLRTAGFLYTSACVRMSFKFRGLRKHTIGSNSDTNLGPISSWVSHWMFSASFFCSFLNFGLNVMISGIGVFLFLITWFWWLAIALVMQVSISFSGKCLSLKKSSFLVISDYECLHLNRSCRFLELGSMGVIW